MNTPDLEPRFLEPPRWRWHTYNTRQGKRLRFGSVYPESRIPTAVILILEGRTEFAEKYFEISRDLTQKNFAVWVLDWQGQGLSDKVSGARPERGHSPAFETHVEDLHGFILDYVKHACVHPDVGRIPMVMLAQSMGANIGLRYLHEHPGMFAAAALCAPMLGIKAAAHLPFSFSVPLTANLSLIAGNSYAFGQKNWTPVERIKCGETLSGDPVRSKIHDLWLEKNPSLRIGGVTFGWLYHALLSCRKVQEPAFLQAIKTDCLLALSGRDDLVDNKAILKAVKNMPHARLLELEDAGHEILMETDGVRNMFLEAFYKLIKETVTDRPGTLKTF